MRIAHARLPALIGALALVIAACGGGDDTADPTTTAAGPATTTMAPTTMAPTTMAPTTMAPTTTSGATETTTGGGDAVELTISAVDSEGFSVSRLEAPAGVDVTVTFENDDTSSGEPHNWHLRTPTDDYFTSIKNGPDTQSVTFVINEPGEYEYFCDTHVTAMKGTFVVTP